MKWNSEPPEYEEGLLTTRSPRDGNLIVGAPLIGYSDTSVLPLYQQILNKSF